MKTCNPISWIIILFLYSILFVCFPQSCHQSITRSKDSSSTAPTGKLVFSARADEQSPTQIYTYTFADSQIRQVTHFGSYNAQPSWSPNGEQIVFVSDSIATTLGPSLWIINVDGSQPHPMKRVPISPTDSLTQPGKWPAWSPDGRYIAFSVCINCEIGGRNYEISLYDFEEDSILALTQNQARDTQPFWVNTTLAFASNRVDPMVHSYDLYTINVDSKEVQRITNVEENLSGYFAWSPITQIILYISHTHIFSYQISNKSTNQIQVAVPNSAFEFTGPMSWGPKGRHIVVIASAFDGSTKQYLYLIELNTEKIKKLTSFEYVSSVEWQ